MNFETLVTLVRTFGPGLSALLILLIVVVICVFAYLVIANSSIALEWNSKKWRIKVLRVERGQIRSIPENFFSEDPGKSLTRTAPKKRTSLSIPDKPKD